jgi:RHS repeat-associated protein
MEAGNLASFTEPNGVVHQYTYDPENRLTNLVVNNQGGTALASYAYALDAAGHRKSVNELSGRTVNYQYDDIYRLMSETIGSDPNSINGLIGYSYDNVGNRLQTTSTVAGVAAGLFNYDPDDRISTDTYDANGSTLTTAGNPNTNTYDFENRLVQEGGITVTYDGDGNRVQKSVNGVVTKYLVDDGINPTGYSQVVIEDSTLNGGTESQYVYGLERISDRWSPAPGTWNLSYYGYDGHGSVRLLTSSTGSVTDTYDYDAFGNLLHITGTTPNVYRFAGEQWDPDLNLYYNRARFLSTAEGRFLTADAPSEDLFEPRELNLYTYTGSDPVNGVDPAGNQFEETIGALAIAATLLTIATVLVLARNLPRRLPEIPIRVNHYTTFKNFRLILADGEIDSPSGVNYFTPNYFLSSKTAKAKLQLSTTPQVAINLFVFLEGDLLSGPTPVLGSGGRATGALEYSTHQPVPIYTRGFVPWPLFP